MADQVVIEQAAIQVLYDQPGTHFLQTAVQILYKNTPDPGSVRVTQSALQVLYKEAVRGERMFPIIQPLTTWQSQADKRKFPLPGEQPIIEE